MLIKLSDHLDTKFTELHFTGFYEFSISLLPIVVSIHIKELPNAAN